MSARCLILSLVATTIIESFPSASCFINNAPIAPGASLMKSHRLIQLRKAPFFVPSPRNPSLPLYANTNDEISSMKAGAMKAELESYGISTKSFFEKKEFEEALRKARAEGLKPADKKKSEKTSPEAASDGKPREEKLAAEIEKCRSMKIGELRKELKELGISSKSFFEKSEFVRALAEARVDGVKKSSGTNQQREEEVRDPSYKDVVMQKFNARDPRYALAGEPIIDVRLG